MLVRCIPQASFSLQFERVCGPAACPERAPPLQHAATPEHPSSAWIHPRSPEEDKHSTRVNSHRSSQLQLHLGCTTADSPTSATGPSLWIACSNSPSSTCSCFQLRGASPHQPHLAVRLQARAPAFCEPEAVQHHISNLTKMPIGNGQINVSLFLEAFRSHTTVRLA